MGGQPTAGTNVITIPLDSFNQNWTYAWAVSGADTTTPFDSHTGLPAVNPNGPAILSVNYSTSNANDFIYILNRGTGTPTGTPALTTMFNDASGTFGGYYYIASTPQSSVTATSPVNTNYILADATVQAAVTGSTVDFAGGFTPSVAFGGGLTVTAPIRNYVDFSGNIGGISSYGRGSYGRGLYSRIDAFSPIFAGDLDIVGQEFFDGDLAPAVTFAGTLQAVHGLGSGDISPIVTFSGDLQLQAGLAGDLAPQVDFSASLTFDTLFGGGFGFTVTFAAAGLISEPLWEATAPCPPPMWSSTTPCPPSMWTPTDSDSVEWEKSELCNG